MYPHGREILIAIRDPARRQMVDRILSHEGFAVTAVGEGLAAIRAASARRFDLVITTIHLPGSLDGVVTVQLVRARQPWIKGLLTGDAATWPRQKGHACDEFIAAPFHRRELLGCVFELLHREVPPETEAEPSTAFRSQSN